MNPAPAGLLTPVVALLLGGCAASHRAAAAPGRPDCSFDAATTCWTLVGRFPGPRIQSRDSSSADPRVPPPVILASRPDTAASR